MGLNLSILLDLLLKVAGVAIVANEVRGVILAGPVLYGLYLSGGTWMALYLAACSLGGIALSVFAPIFMLRFVRRRRLAKAVA